MTPADAAVAADVHAAPTPGAGPGADAGVLDELYALLASRRGGDPGQSYSARLMARGTDAILKKIGEEATEVVLAAKDADAGRDPDRAHLVAELADLCYHALVLMAHQGVPPGRVRAELQRRQGTSGLVEKASRPHQQSIPEGA